jgi:hypothetical protein
VATIKRHLVVVPDRAERETGFPYWLVKVWNIGRNTGARLIFYASTPTLDYLRKVHEKYPVDAEFNEFDHWEDFLILSRDLRPHDNLLVVMSRRNQLSHNRTMESIPLYLNKYFQAYNFILVFPKQDDADNDRPLINPSVLSTTQSNDDEIALAIHRLFK